MIVEIPVFFADKKVPIRVEVQFRTIAMDFWASLEHQMKYKKEVTNEEEIIAKLKECADIIAETDLKMQEINNMINE
jgi:putative GTP pyrophosphokinase